VSTVKAEQVLSNGERGHSVDVVRDTTQSGSALSGSERLKGYRVSSVTTPTATRHRLTTHLPPRRIPLSSVETSPVHETGSVLVRTKEQDLRVLSTGKVHDLLLDTRRLSGNQQVDDSIDKVLKAQRKVGIEVGQDSRLGTTFDDETVPTTATIWSGQ
jgi:hypothetical protein